MFRSIGVSKVPLDVRIAVYGCCMYLYVNLVHVYTLRSQRNLSHFPLQCIQHFFLSVMTPSPCRKTVKSVATEQSPDAQQKGLDFSIAQGKNDIKAGEQIRK